MKGYWTDLSILYLAIVVIYNTMPIGNLFQYNYIDS